MSARSLNIYPNTGPATQAPCDVICPLVGAATYVSGKNVCTCVWTYVPVPVVRQYIYKLFVGTHVRPVGFASDFRCVGRSVPLAKAEACTVPVGD